MNDEFLELLRLLRSHNVDFLVVGAYALAVYLDPRATQDLDVWMKQSEENLEKFGLAMEEFGFQISRESLMAFASGRKLIRIGRPPNQIDFLSFLGPTGDEFSFDDIASRAESSDMYGVSISVPSAQDMLRSKLAANRPKDQGDIAQLRLLIESKPQ